jgi:hypothetical protein
MWLLSGFYIVGALVLFERCIYSNVCERMQRLDTESTRRREDSTCLGVQGPLVRLCQEATRWSFTLSMFQCPAPNSQLGATFRLQSRKSNTKHVETLGPRRCCAGTPNTGAAFLLGRRCPKVLLRGIAQGHIGCRYGSTRPRRIFCICWRIVRIQSTNRSRPLPRRSLERPDQVLPKQQRCRRLRHG